MKTDERDQHIVLKDYPKIFSSVSQLMDWLKGEFQVVDKETDTDESSERFVPGDSTH